MVLNQTYTSEEIDQDIKILYEKHSDFTSYRIMGNSHDHRPISMLRIGLGIEALVLTAGIHGQESINPVLLARLAEEYCQAYAENTYIEKYSVRELLNRCSVTILPLVNPDGYETALHGFKSIRNPILRQMCKMQGIEWEHWKYNARGVDINRNFPCKSYTPQQLGEYPASEQETQALIRVFDEYETIGYIDFHSRGRVIYYYRQAMPFSYNQKNHKLARYMQRLSDYSIGKRTEECDAAGDGGSPVNYYSQLLGKPAIVVETVENSARYPLEPIWQEHTYQEIRTMPLEIIHKVIR